jgi:Putative transposase/Transposase zinc-binding domain
VPSETSFTYLRHEPENSVLYRALQENFETFRVISQKDSGSGCLPRHVYEEVEAYLRCGILAHGFTRLRCESCKAERLIAFSCKKRGFCPSCAGKRMNEVANHLVQSVIPPVCVRQWVISFPFSVRYALAYHPNLVSGVLSLFIRIISNWIVKRARARGIIGKTGAVTFVQRFGGAINLNVHLHSLFLDGVYYQDRGKLKFFRVLAPTDNDVAVLVQRIRDRVVRYLTKKGYGVDDFSENEFTFDQSVMAELAGASIQNRIALGEREGQKVRKIGQNTFAPDVFHIGNRCAVCDGFSLHANVKTEARDRDKLEKLCRYTARPPIALERLSETPDGKILYRLKTQYSDGTTHVLFDPMELVEKVVALIPPPRANLLRYHGVFAPNSKDRARIVPTDSAAPQEKKERSLNRSWSELLKRSFAIDVLTCSSCGGKMRLVSHIEEPTIVSQILGHVGLSTEAPRKHPPRAPPQTEMFESMPAPTDDFYQASFD